MKNPLLIVGVIAATITLLGLRAQADSNIRARNAAVLERVKKEQVCGLPRRYKFGGYYPCDAHVVVITNRSVTYALLHQVTQKGTPIGVVWKVVEGGEKDLRLKPIEDRLNGCWLGTAECYFVPQFTPLWNQLEHDRHLVHSRKA